MNPESSQQQGNSHVYEMESTYSVELVAELAGVDTHTVLHYQELGVLTPTKDTEDTLEFDTEELRHLCRLEQLRQSHALTDSGLKLIADLLKEIEHLRAERRQALR